MPMLAAQLALAVAALFTGAALYINVAEQPARLELDDRALLTEWKKAYQRGFAMQAPLAFLGFALGVAAWYPAHQVGFLVGALCMIANWPWTLAVMMKLNKQLMATSPEQAGPQSRALVFKWNRLHAVRTVLGFLAVLAFLSALAGK